MNEDQGTEIVERQEQPIAIADGLLDFAAIQRAELMVEGINKIKIISLKVTGPQDWSLQGGKPFLENIGCMKIARLWGVNFKDRIFRPEGGERISDGKGDYILFTCVGRAEFKGQFVEDIGTCSTRDDFFGTKKNAEGTRVPKALEDVDLENIKKKAVTNMQGRLLKKILGLSYTMADLEAAGIKLDGSKAATYATGGAGGGKISDAQKNRLFAILMNGCGGDEDKKSRQDALKKFMVEKYKTEHTKDINRTDYDAIVKQAEAIAGASTVGA